MVIHSATSYVRSLSDLLLSTQVTDENRTRMPLDEQANKVVEMILAVKSAGKKVMLVGNGGSAAIVSHMHNDLCKSAGVRAIVFHELPLLTALTNDDCYECVFERPLELWGDPGDLLFAVSSSGQSENILRAAKAALSRGCQVITLSGFNAGNRLRGMGHVNFYVPSQSYGYVEMTHSVLAHFLTDCAALRTGGGTQQTEIVDSQSL